MTGVFRQVRMGFPVVARSAAAYVVFGGSGGFGETVDRRQVLDLSTLTAAERFVIQDDAA